MSDVITEYKKWKQQGEDLRVQAKQAMETRYHELLGEVEGEEGRRRTIDREKPSRGSSAGTSGREAQCRNCWTSEAAGDGEEEARQGKGLRKANQGCRRQNL
jgi:hypothetical protein